MWSLRRNRIRWTAVMLLLTALAASTGIGADKQPMPTFEKSRPKGPKQMLQPLPTERPSVPDVRFGNFKPYNAIDNFILARIQEKHARPRPVCDDWDFARRSSLDLVGVIPTAADLERYFNWEPGQRRAKWVDLLLGQQQYADHWTTFWGDLLRERGRIQGVPDNSLKKYIHSNLARNRPYDAWVREMLTASGKPVDKPATGFILRDRGDATNLTVTVTQTFLGVQLRCAQCHDHPFDWWTKQDFDGMTGFWKGTRARVYERTQRFARGAKIDMPSFEVVSRDRAARGVFLTGMSSDKGVGRDGLADLLARRDNPYFARVAVNRLWTQMMGIGLVRPVDNFSALNPPSHPELLDWLAIEFIDSGYDLKHMLRLMANSRTYQQTTSEKVTRLVRKNAEPEDADMPGGVLFDGMPLKRMSAEQLQDSILVATGRYLPDDRRFTPSIEMTYPPDPRSFLRTFGATDRETLLTRNPTGSIQQALTLLNGDLLNDAVKMHDQHPLRAWRSERRWTTEQMVDALFAQILTRPPTPNERNLAIRFLGGGFQDDKWEDLQWALLNTREFQFIR